MQAAQVTGGSGAAAYTAAIWYYPNNPGGITGAAFNSGGAASKAMISEYSGVAAASPLDQTGTSSITNSKTLSTSTAAAVLSGGLAVSAFAEHATASGAATYTAGTGWTNLAGNGMTASTDHLTSDYQLQLAAAVCSETQTSTLQADWVGAIAVFKHS
jgi:hypothetical protein